MKKYALLFSLTISVLFISLTSSNVYGQAPSLEEISGKYVDDKVGVEITFPQSWTGMTMGLPEGSMTIVYPGGMTAMNENSFTAMTLMTNKKMKTDSPQPPFDNPEKSTCDTPSTNPTTIGGVSATETVISCKNEDGTMIKLKAISAETTTHWIVVSFMSSASDYDAKIGEFDDSVKTLKIQNAVATSEQITTPPVPELITTPPVNLQSSTMQVMAEGSPVELVIQSSSQLSNLGLDEENKKLSFTTIGDNDGVTVIPVGNVLEGEFMVMVDGQVTEDYEIIDDQGVQSLKLGYSSGSHDISISGTRVVPEFGSIAVLILMVSIVSVIAISSKVRLSQKF